MENPFIDLKILFERLHRAIDQLQNPKGHTLEEEDHIRELVKCLQYALYLPQEPMERPQEIVEALRVVIKLLQKEFELLPGTKRQN